MSLVFPSPNHAVIILNSPTLPSSEAIDRASLYVRLGFHGIAPFVNFNLLIARRLLVLLRRTWVLVLMCLRESSLHVGLGFHCVAPFLEI
jgi:hypothetical protein